MPNRFLPPRFTRALAMAVAALALSVGVSSAQEPPKLKASGALQIDAIRGIKTSRSAIQNKIDSRLFLGILKLRNDARLAPLTDFRFVRPEADGRVPVDIVVTKASGIKPVVNRLSSLGAEIKSQSYGYRRISARMRLEDMEALAAMPEVRKIRQAMPALTSAINISEGDATHGADETRGFFGATGAGVKVCVISDGVDSLASLVASGDLPAGIDVIPGGSGDEGSAMLEIVHDLAPGAALGFASALPDEATFAQNILDLAAAPHNCNIIVDDIIYLDESPFQDGPVAQSVNTVTAAGVLYFSSAGNEGNKTDLTSGVWEGDFLASAAADPGPLAGANLHDFGDGGNSILVEFGGGNPPLLIWAEHYDLATGSASTDFDLYDMDGGLTTIFDAATDVQDGAGGDDFPIEFIGGGTFGGERLLIDKFAAGTTSSVPMFNLIVFRGELDDNRVTNGTTRGHSAANDAFSVAATPAAASFDGITPDGPYPGLFTAANESESFTADGPRRIILSPTGTELTPGNRTSTGGVVRQKPDITAADGVATAAPGFNPFYGTSAAAPHAAALAALCKSAAPGITPAALRTALLSSAIDIEAPGVDVDTGAGIVMAHAFLDACGASPQAFLDDGTPTYAQVGGDGDAFVEIGEDWSVTVPLTNVGGAGATAISGVLTSSTPGVVILNGVSAYPDLANGPLSTLAGGATASNTTPFSFTTSSAVPCGATLSFTLTVTYTGGIASPQTFNFSVVTGAPGTPVTFSFTGPPVAIPDGADLSGNSPGAPVVASLPVAGVVGNVYDVNLQIDGATCSTTAGSATVGVDHSFVNDLDLTLIGPGGSPTVLAVNNTDGSGNNFCQTLLDDESAGASIQTVVSANAPFTGSFTPNAALSAFDGINPNGTWQLQAQDFFSQDTGNLRAFSVIITPAVCDAPALTSNVTATKAVTGGTQVAGGTVIYTITLTNTGTGTQPDNAGNEFTDTLPAGLTFAAVPPGAAAPAPTATSGTISGAGVNPVTWNGSIPPGGTVTLVITANIQAGTGGQTILNQGTVSSDANRDFTNETSTPTDNPGGAPNDATPITVAGGAVIQEIPTLSEVGLALLVLMLSAAAVLMLRRRTQNT